MDRIQELESQTAYNRTILANHDEKIKYLRPASSLMIMQNEPYSRPQSVFNIVEVPDATTTNPEPATEVEKSFGEFITLQKLKDVSGVSNLERLTELRIKVDTTETSIGNIGSMAPNLKTLNLSNSYVASVRDLGTCLNNLNTLWLSRCCLAELDGISCIAALKELYVAYNEIFDISPLSMLENLEVIDLEGNNIDDITQVEFLTLCSKLRTLTLKGNPLESTPSPETKQQDLKYYSYRDAMLSCLPQLDVLDDEAYLVETIDGKQVKRSKPQSVKEGKLFKDDLRLIQCNLKNIENDGTEDSGGETSSTARPISARIRYQSAKPSSGSERIISAKASAIASINDPRSPDELTEAAKETHCSDLTYGNVMCGNPVQALRRRGKKNARKNFENKLKQRNVNDVKLDHSFQPERSYLTDEEKTSHDGILDELKQWRIANQRLFDENLSSNKSDGNRHTRSKTANTSSSPTFSPAPPSLPRPSRTSPSNIRRSLPSPPLKVTNQNNRPHTANEMRSRRYRVVSPLQSNQHTERMLLDSLGSIDEQETSSIGVDCINNNFYRRNNEVVQKRPATRAALKFITTETNLKE